VNEIIVFLNCLEDLVVDGVVVVAQTHNLLCVDLLAGHHMAQKFIEYAIFNQQKVIQLQE
jgi:hypothetical protein